MEIPVNMFAAALTAMKKERLPRGGQRQPRVVLILIPVRLGPPFRPIAIPDATTHHPHPKLRTGTARRGSLSASRARPMGPLRRQELEHVRQNQLRFSYNMSDEPRNGVIVALLTRCVP